MLPSRLSLALALFATVALAGCSTLSTSKDYYGIDTTGQSVVFLIDISGSMEGKQEGTLEDAVRGEAANRAGSEVQRRVGGSVGRVLGRRVRNEATKLGGAKRELIPALRGLDESTTFGIVTFGDAISPWRDTLVPATSGNRNAAALFVDGLSANGGTPMMAGLEAAFQLRPQVIFVMTDGKPNDGDAGSIRRNVRALNPSGQVTVHTVGLGPDQDRDFLANLANDNGGQFVERR